MPYSKWHLHLSPQMLDTALAITVPHDSHPSRVTTLPFQLPQFYNIIQGMMAASKGETHLALSVYCSQMFSSPFEW